MVPHVKGTTIRLISVRSVPAVSTELNTPSIKKSSGGCNLDVCIDVVGKGLYVDYIDVYQVVGNGPATAAILFRGSTNWPGGLWGYGANEDGISIDYGYNFPSTGQVCGEIIGSPGKPCEEIEN